MKFRITRNGKGKYRLERRDCLIRNFYADDTELWNEIIGAKRFDTFEEAQIALDDLIEILTWIPVTK